MAIRDFKSFSRGNKSDYHDGIAVVYARPEKRSSFNALMKADECLDKKVCIAFREEFFRQQDVQFMENQDAGRSKKIAVRKCPLIKKNDLLDIEEVRYQIDHIDYDNRNNEAYLYLEEYDA